MEKLNSFTFGDRTLSTQFVETMLVVEGVACDVYSHPETDERDLGIITIQGGYRTPLQKFRSGDKTIEGWISGKGSLTVIHIDGTKTSHRVGDDQDQQFFTIVEIGETIQWEADPNSELVVFEICYPPYQEGRFENLAQD